MSALLVQPPAIVYQARRSETDSLDSTTRIALDISLSSQARLALDAAFYEKVQQGRAANASAEETARRRDVILQELLRSCVSVDVVMHDFSLVTYYTSPCCEEEDVDEGAVALGTSGTMAVVPSPSIEISAPSSAPGMIHLCVLPRTLPISSTHSGRPFRLIIRVRVGCCVVGATAGQIPAGAGAGAASAPKGRAMGGSASPRGGMAVDEVLVTTPFHVLAKEPSRQSTQGPRPRGQASKKRKRAAAVSGSSEGAATMHAMLPGGVVLTPRDLQLLDVTEAAVRMSLQSEMNGTTSESVLSLLYGDLNKVSALRMLASGLLQPVQAPAAGTGAQPVYSSGIEEPEGVAGSMSGTPYSLGLAMGMGMGMGAAAGPAVSTSRTPTPPSVSVQASGTSSEKGTTAEQADTALRSMRSAATKRTKSESSVTVPALPLVSSGLVLHPASLGVRAISDSSTLTGRTHYSSRASADKSDEETSGDGSSPGGVHRRSPGPLGAAPSRDTTAQPVGAGAAGHLQQGMIAQGMYWNAPSGSAPTPVPVNQHQLQHPLQQMHVQHMQQQFAMYASAATGLGGQYINLHQLPLAMAQPLQVKQGAPVHSYTGDGVPRMQAHSIPARSYTTAAHPANGRPTGAEDEAAAMATLGALASAVEYDMRR